MTRSFLRDTDLSDAEIREILGIIGELKPRIEAREQLEELKGKIVVLLFEKPSTRTRNSFETAVMRLGGEAVYNAAGEMQLTRGEPIPDTARILGSYYDAMVARVFAQETVDQLAEYSGIPVINGLSDLNHPTQVICDLFTVQEVKGELDNVCHSLMIACSKVGMNINVACPEGYMPHEDIVKQAEGIAAENGCKVSIVHDPGEAAGGADALYTDVWVSMGQDDERDKRLKAFEGFQINADLLKLAAPDAVVMHCLPAQGRSRSYGGRGPTRCTAPRVY